MFISAQILSITAGALIGIAFLLKSKDKIMLLTVLSSLIFAISYYLLSAFVGVAISVIMAVLVFATFTCLKFSKKPQRDMSIVSSVLTCLAIVLGVILWDYWYCTLPIVAVALLGFGYTTKHLGIVRICIMLEIAIHIVYNIFVRSYGGVAVQSILLVYAIVIFVLNITMESSKAINPIEMLFHIDSERIYSVTPHKIEETKQKETEQKEPVEDNTKNEIPNTETKEESNKEISKETKEVSKTKKSSKKTNKDSLDSDK